MSAGLWSAHASFTAKSGPNRSPDIASLVPRKSCRQAYEFIGFGDVYGPKPYEFILFDDIYGPKPYEFIWFGDIYGPKAYEFIGSGDAQGP